MENQIVKIRILDYTEDPGPRYIRQGADSGEDYYHKVLNREFHDALAQSSKLCVDLDGTSGYMSSFLDEAFGNLVYDFTLDIVKKNIQIVSEEEPEWVDMLTNETYNEWEQRRRERREPVMTKDQDHEAWYRYEGGEYVSKVWVKSKNQQ